MRGRIGNSMRRMEAQSIYEKWWLGKYVKLAVANKDAPFKKVIKVEFIGPPSAFCGQVYLTFEDGTSCPVFSDSYRPRKKDVLIQNKTEGGIE